MATSANATDTPAIKIRQATTPADMAAFREVNKLYLEWLNEDLGFQGVDEEMANLPGVYGPDMGGCMLLAYTENSQNSATPASGGNEDTSTTISNRHNQEKFVGVVALRALQGKQIDSVTSINGVPVEKICEMKRLFVVMPWQRRGIGRQLVDAIQQHGKSMGYDIMVLDTLERLTASNALYEKAGFEFCEPYSLCPLEGPRWYAKDL